MRCTALRRGDGRLPRPRREVISWLPAAHIAERNAHHYLPVVYAAARYHLPGPARDRRVPAAGAPDLVLRRAADLGEAEGGARGEAREPARRAGASGGQKALEAALPRCGSSRAARRCRRSSRRPSRRPTSRCSRTCARSSGSTRSVAVNVGAAPTPLEVIEFFHAIGIPIGELWGMSETCGTGHRQPARADQARHRRAARARASS